MKNLLLLLSLVSLTLFSCDKDDDCTPGSLETVIVGTWTTLCNGTERCEVQFLADGTFIDDEEALVFNPNGAEMEYFVDSDTMIRIRVVIGSPVDYHIPVTRVECDEITLDIATVEYELDRK